MVWMGIRTHKAHGPTGVTGALDLPAGKYSRAVGINQKRQKHSWRILLAAGAPMIDLSHGCIHRLNGIDAHSIDCTALFNTSNGNRRHGVFIEKGVDHNIAFANVLNDNFGAGVHVWNEEVK
jgi:hypothetical protein